MEKEKRTAYNWIFPLVKDTYLTIYPTCIASWMMMVPLARFV